MIFIRRWSFPSGNGIADVQISLFSLSTSKDFLETAAEKNISTFSSYYGDFNLIWFYDNWENSICWWRSCMINRSLTATKKTLWRVFFFFLHYNNSCTSFRGSAPLWILTRDAGWPWRCSWEGGTQPCVSGPASGQSIASLRSSPTPPYHRPAVETDKFW